MLQMPGTTPALGPLWISKGEGFSPSGVEKYLTDVIRLISARMASAKHYKSQLEAAQQDERDNVHQSAILSMSEDEIVDAIKIVNIQV